MVAEQQDACRQVFERGLILAAEIYLAWAHRASFAPMLALRSRGGLAAGATAKRPGDAKLGDVLGDVSHAG